MGDDSGRPRREPRAPEASSAGPVSASPPELPEALLQRMQAVVNAAHGQAAKEQEARQKRATPLDQTSHPTGSVSLAKRDDDAESDTDPFLLRLASSGAVASPPASEPSSQPDQSAQTNGTAQPDDAVKPGQPRKGAQALRRRIVAPRSGTAPPSPGPPYRPNPNRPNPNAPRKPKGSTPNRNGPNPNRPNPNRPRKPNGPQKQRTPHKPNANRPNPNAPRQPNGPQKMPSRIRTPSCHAWRLQGLLPARRPANRAHSPTNPHRPTAPRSQTTP